jgi:hypothetical protein
MGGIKFGVEPSMIIDFNSGPTNASLAAEVETCLKLTRFRGHPTFWVEGVHDVEAKTTLPT